MIKSNNDDLCQVAETFNIPYHVFPVTEETKHDQEQKQMDLLREHNIDLLVLALYMQVLIPTFCDAFHNRIINIHHSFLPAFMGKMPYHRAHERGVKLIGRYSALHHDGFGSGSDHRAGYHARVSSR